MAIDLLLSTDKDPDAALTTAELDTNLLTIQTAVNTLQSASATLGNVVSGQLVLRSIKGTTLTNDEVDANFVFLDGRANNLQDQIDNLETDVIPDLNDNIEAQLAVKQPLAPKLTSVANITTNGLLSVSGNVVTPRTITAASTNIVVTNGGGVAGNPTVDIGTDVLTSTSTHAVTNKTIDGTLNTLLNLPTSSFSGTMTIAKGGTGGTTATQARTNLAVLPDTGTNGVVVRTGSDATAARAIQTSGIGLSVTNGDGVAGNPTVVSNATATNTPSTVVARDASGNFTAGIITATLDGNVLGNAATVTNGVYTTGSYANPSWITSLAGSKVSNIPNGSLANSTVTINGTAVSLGGSISLDVGGVATNTPLANVKRDASGNFAAGVITADLNGNAATSTTAALAAQATRLSTPRQINGIAFDGQNNITVFDNSKLALSGGTLSGFLNLHANPINALHAATKQYVDQRSLTVTSGTLILDSSSNPSDNISPPSGKTMANLQGFIPAFGTTVSATPSYVVNLILVIDIKPSTYLETNYNGSSKRVYRHAVNAAKNLIERYMRKGNVAVCVCDVNGTLKKKYRWRTAAQAPIVLDAAPDFVDHDGPTGSVLQAWGERPFTGAPTIIYYLTDGQEDSPFGDAFGGTQAAWQSFLETNQIVSYVSVVGERGRTDWVDKFAWDGRKIGTGVNRTVLGVKKAIRALLDDHHPETASPGLYNAGSIQWEAKTTHIEVSLTNESDANNVAINWLAIWN